MGPRRLRPPRAHPTQVLLSRGARVRHGLVALVRVSAIALVVEVGADVALAGYARNELLDPVVVRLARDHVHIDGVRLVLLLDRGGAGELVSVDRELVEPPGV